MKTILLIFTVALSTSLAQCATPFADLFPQVEQSQPQEVEIDPVLAERGIEVYLENYCGVCHQLNVAETRGNFGPHHNNTGLVAAEYIQLPSYDGNATTAEEYIRESILEPQIFYTPGFEATNHHMASYAHLPEEDIDALVAMLLSQRETE